MTLVTVDQSRFTKLREAETRLAKLQTELAAVRSLLRSAYAVIVESRGMRGVCECGASWACGPGGTVPDYCPWCTGGAMTVMEIPEEKHGI